MKVNFLGGAREVGASSILLNIKEKNILLDCGIRQSSTKDPLPDFRIIQEMGGVDAIVVSHAHLDHTGALPIISKEYPNVKIYMNNMTKDLVRVLLHDSLKIMGSREAEIPLYAEKDVEDMLNRIFTINYGVDFEILDGIKITFYNAGHIAGASAVNISSSEGTVFYSGDFSVFSQKSVEGAKIPKLRPDMAIFESTYGDKLHSNREIEEERLIDIVRECIEKKGKMLIPAFALGRAQEVLLILKKAINNKKIKNVNIYVDGMIKQINRVYKTNPLYLKSNLGKKILKGIEPFYDKNICEIQKKEQREEILKTEEPVIIVSSSGMLTGGPSQSYAEKIVSMENGYIVITGYQDEESPGRKILNLLKCESKDRTLEINGKVVPVKCKVDKIGLSAHADKSEIKALGAKLMPKNIFLVHGEEKVINYLAEDMSKEMRSRIYTPKCGEIIEIQIGNPRKQIKRKLSYLMKENEDITKDNISKLWDFVRENYGDRFFTVEQLLIIWKGSASLKNEEIENLQKLLVSEVYFENDLRRFFMFKVKTKQEVEEDLKPKGLKPNEINELALEYFSKYNYKKVGLNQEEKKVILYFDFPQGVNKSIKGKFEKFTKETKWQIEINGKPNNNAIDILIRELLDGEDVKKISYYFNENKVLVNLEKEKDLKIEKEKFKEITGLEMLIKNASSGNPMLDENLVFKAKSNQMEQNEALRYIDESFKVEEFKPYKKSIKTNGNDKIIELTFISPKVGKRYVDKIKNISNNIGWNMALSNSVNQNQIINMALKLCKESNIKLIKNPSFNPCEFVIMLKLEEIEETKLNKIKKEFDYVTGCNLKWIK